MFDIEHDCAETIITTPVYSKPRILESVRETQRDLDAEVRQIFNSKTAKELQRHKENGGNLYKNNKKEN